MLFKARSVTILLLVVSSFLCGYSMEGNAMINGYYCEITDSNVSITASEGRTISDDDIKKLETALDDTVRAIRCIGVDFSLLEMRPILEALVRRGFKKLYLESCENCNLLIPGDRFEFSNTEIGPESVQALAAALGKNKKLISLRLSGNNIGAEGVKALAAALKDNTTLASLDLIFNNIDSEGGKELAAALEKNTTLACLSLIGNDIGYAGAQAFATVLKENKTLTSLNLSINNIGSEGWKELAATLKNNITLTSLYFNENNIGPEDVKELVAVLENNKALIRLSISSNNIGFAGAQELAAALAKNTTLTDLDLIDNDIGPAGAQELAAALKENTTLTDLYLRYNNVGHEGGKALAAALEKNTTLAYLDLSGDDIGAAAADRISEIFKRNRLITPIREKLKQAFFKISKTFWGNGAKIPLPDIMHDEININAEVEFFYNSLMFGDEEFFAKLVKEGWLTKDDFERINEIRKFEADRIKRFSPSAPSATASTSSSTVEQNSLYIPRQLNIGAISDLAGILTEKEAKPAIPVSSSSSASISASASSSSADTLVLKARNLRYAKDYSLTTARDKLLKDKEEFLKNISARYIAGMRNAYQAQGDVLWGGDLELGRIAADILHLNIIVHRYAYNPDVPAPARGGIRPGRIIGTTVVGAEYTNAIHLWYDGFHYNSADENGDMIYGQVPGDGNCLFHSIIRATDPFHTSSLEQVTVLRNKVADALQNEVDTILPHQQLALNPIVARFNAIIEARNMDVFLEALAALPIGRLRNEAEELHFRLQDAENQLLEFKETQATERSLLSKSSAASASSSIASTTASSSTPTNTTPSPAIAPPNSITLPFFANHEHGVLQTPQPAPSSGTNNTQGVEQDNIINAGSFFIPNSHLK